MFIGFFTQRRMMMLNEYIDQVPQKHQKYVAGIEQLHDSEDDGHWLISLMGYAECADTDWACHCVSGETLEQAIRSLDNCAPCNCDQCKNNK